MTQNQPAGWYPDPEQPGSERYWFGQEWSQQRRPMAPPGGPGLGQGQPGGGPGYQYPGAASRPSGTSGLAIASLVLSILWLGGLGSLLAVIFGATARRKIRRSGGAISGSGLAIAGLVIGIVGLVGAVLLYVLLAAAGSTIHRAFTPQTLSLGQTAQISSTLHTDGIAKVTVYSVHYPVASQSATVSPSPGKEFAVADVQACAGPNGSQGGVNPLEFSLRFSGSQSVAANPFFGSPKTPALNTDGLAANQCTRGYLPFEIVTGTHPTAIQYLFVGAFSWSLPPSG